MRAPGCALLPRCGSEVTSASGVTACAPLQPCSHRGGRGRPDGLAAPQHLSWRLAGARLHSWRLLLQRAYQLDTCIYGAYCFSARVPVAHAPPIPQAEALTKVDADWMVNGKFGMIQFTKG